MDYIIETKSLQKQYGTKIVVNKISIHIKKGDIYGLIGKNGAGKTTLMKLLLGLIPADDGEIQIFGSMKLDKARRKIGSLIESPAIYKNETALENMKRFSLLLDTSEKEIMHILSLVGLKDTGNKKVGDFSLGMRQRLGIAIALLGNPEILILDEPINGLDPAGIKEIRDVILKLNAKGVTFLISSHLLDELGKIATHYGIVADGTLVEEISAEELAQTCKTAVSILTDNGEMAVTILQNWKKDLLLERKGNKISIFSELKDVSELVEMLVNKNIRIYELRNETIGLEDFFIERLGK